MKLIIIAMVPRSGSTLAFAIAKSLLGLDNSDREIANWDYLVENYGIKKIDAAFNPSPGFYENQMNLMRQVKETIKTTSDQIGVIKTNWIDFDRWLLTDPSDWAETVEFVFIDRLNWIRQAYSLLKAQETGIWHKGVGSKENLKSSKNSAMRKFSIHEMNAAINELNFNRLGWVRYFAEKEITPISLTYEQLADNPVDVIKNVLNSLGVSWQDKSINIPFEKTATKSDEIRISKFVKLYLKENSERYLSNSESSRIFN